ncbi:hypothetical protein J2Z48_001218 [Croceifilum oryzae]|uniref:Glycosyltransferase family 2 protein n=2 Tax=Croceifilum oryzae TaxID=1553429 RepID=A0AAJ1TLV0_9BACL|nr:hypothetical protein [Croceifilum oryzae]
MKMTVIAHFYNEEYLLPWWLMHHTKIFDHGILINKGSTDRSVEICKEYAPHWEIRHSDTGSFFDVFQTDHEVMKAETEAIGWKMVLNITEFLCFADRTKFLRSLSKLGSQMYHIEGIFMVDHPNERHKELTYERPLVEQKYHGYLLDQLRWHYIGSNSRGRFIHCHSHGSYVPGRHSSGHHSIPYPDHAYLLWFGYSPWNEEIVQRKLQIAPTLAPHPTAGIHHRVDRNQLETWYTEISQKTTDLRLTNEYKYMFPHFGGVK